MEIILVGMVENAGRDSVLKKLRDCQPGHDFEWFEAKGSGARVPENHFRRLLCRITENPDAKVLKLYALHPEQQNHLYHKRDDLTPVPKEISSEKALVEYVLGCLFPPWQVSQQGQALLAVLSKLLRNKSWNADVSGHQWTREVDLLGQAPVRRRRFPDSVQHAKEVLQHGKNGGLLLTKGGSKTPKEWSINTAYLPQVKRVFLERDMDALPMGDFPGLKGYALSGEANVSVDDGIWSPTVISICKEVGR